MIRYRRRKRDTRFIREVPPDVPVLVLALFCSWGNGQVLLQLECLSQDFPKSWLVDRPPSFRGRDGTPAEASEQEKQPREAPYLLLRRENAPAHRHVVVGVNSC